MDERLKRAFYAVPAAAGMVFCLWYLSRAAINLCYTDYIRLVNSYLPDVTNPAKFLVPDILTRCPVTYLFRIINVKLLRYNTWFDMILGVISMGLGAFALGLYARRREMNPVYFLLLMAVYYSLHQWEMLTNGTGWVCYLAVSGFFWHFAVLDYAAWDGASHRRDRLLLYLLPFPVILAAAGQYCASYAAILFFAYVMLLARDRGMRRRTMVWAFGLIFAMTAFGLYLWSNSYAVYEHRETTDLTLMAAWKTDFLFPARFLVKSFASDLVGCVRDGDSRHRPLSVGAGQNPADPDVGGYDPSHPAGALRGAEPPAGAGGPVDLPGRRLRDELPLRPAVQDGDPGDPAGLCGGGKRQG